MALSKIQKQYILKAALAVVVLLVIDQTVKVWIKTHLQLYQSIDIFSWFKIYFTENPGMAFGIELFDTYILTIFRLIVVCILGYFILKLIKADYKFGYIMCLSCILAGALGNILDCVFYGVIFDHSYGQVATFMPPDGGYSTFLHGKVVDMLYFPLIHTVLPEWLPFRGGTDFIFFRPIFNIADSCICVSVFVLLIFYRQSLSESFSKEKKVE
ncbi:MAG: lipoprotein signal peptidase [Tannerella sp.]|nr:lipoprotein signal peptidase [Tannerella sp.]